MDKWEGNCPEGSERGCPRSERREHILANKSKPCFFHVEMTDLDLAKAAKPSQVLKQPDILPLVLQLRRSRSAKLFVKGTL